MKLDSAYFFSRPRLSYIAESRVVLLNILVAIALSSLLLITYLKRILFDF